MLTGATGDDLRILFVADVVGHPGRDAVKAILPALKKELRPDLTIVNGENAAGGFGLTSKIAAELKGAGADVITTGNHVFAQKELLPELANLQTGAPARQLPAWRSRTGIVRGGGGGLEVLVINLMGRIFTWTPATTRSAAPTRSWPRSRADLVSSATCTRKPPARSPAMGWYLDGRVAAVVGTHTHVPTPTPSCCPGAPPT